MNNQTPSAMPARFQQSGYLRSVSVAALCVAGLLVTASNGTAADWPQWRGPTRDGVSKETGLLREWPKEGPKLVWKRDGIGTGYAAPSVAGGRVYILANEGLENEFVQALSVEDGKKVWSTRLGMVGNPNQKPTFPAARSTPTVEGDVLYALGSDGDLACVETGTGKIRWQKNLRKDFEGKPGTWAYAESPLIDGEALVCTPGGASATVVALNKKTGDVLWKAATAEGDEAAYASAVPLEAEGGREYVQLLQKGLVGLDAKTGKVLWRYAKATSRYGANIPSPLVMGSTVFVGAAGTGAGLVKVKGATAEEAYFDAKLPTAIGGAVTVGGVIFGTTAKALVCIDAATGQVKWDNAALGSASLCTADGLLFLHGENGEVALVEASSDAYKEKGRFAPAEQPAKSNPMEKAWAYPALADGRLYIRDHGVLWCYAVK